jgi:hypothetical protein
LAHSGGPTEFVRASDWAKVPRGNVYPEVQHCGIVDTDADAAGLQMLDVSFADIDAAFEVQVVSSPILPQAESATAAVVASHTTQQLLRSAQGAAPAAVVSVTVQRRYHAMTRLVEDDSVTHEVFKEELTQALFERANVTRPARYYDPAVRDEIGHVSPHSEDSNHLEKNMMTATMRQTGVKEAALLHAAGKLQREPPVASTVPSTDIDTVNEEAYATGPDAMPAAATPAAATPAAATPAVATPTAATPAAPAPRRRSKRSRKGTQPSPANSDYDLSTAVGGTESEEAVATSGSAPTSSLERSIGGSTSAPKRPVSSSTPSARSKRTKPDPELLPQMPLALDSKELLRVALKHRAECQDVVDYVCGSVDKQSVPAARILLNNKRFHALLLQEGATREAVFLSVMGAAFTSFDRGHLCPLWRDYTIARAYYMLCRIAGAILDSANMLSSSYGKRARGIEVCVLLRFLSMCDARAALIRHSGTYQIDRANSTNPVENCFSELVGLVGYMPTAVVGLAAFTKAERRALSKMNEKIKQVVSRRKLYPPSMLDTRAKWNDGQRCYVWFPTMEYGYPLTTTCKPLSGTTHTTSRKAAKGSVATNRQHAQSAAAAASKHQQVK